jgi:hypothetical protein
MHDVDDAKKTIVEKDGIFKLFPKEYPNTQRTEYDTNQADGGQNESGCN